jgi:heme-degrading monooxygenase HmoA
MIEVVFTYDFLADIDEHAYAKLAHKATRMMVSADGFIEFHANRNIVGSPLVRRTSVWESFAHYAAFVQQPEFQKINNEFRTYVKNLEVFFWGPSLLVPESIKAEK